MTNMTAPLHRVKAQELYEAQKQYQQENGIQNGDVALPAAWHLLPLRQQRVFEQVAQRVNESHRPYRARESTHYVSNRGH